MICFTYWPNNIEERVILRTKLNVVSLYMILARLVRTMFFENISHVVIKNSCKKISLDAYIFYKKLAIRNEYWTVRKN